MIQTLKQFTGGARLFDAVSSLLAKLKIEFDRETAEPINVADLYDGPMPKNLTDALKSISNTYFIGIVNDQSLAGAKSADSLDDVAETMRHGGKYDGMFVFACDAKPDANLTRTAASALTRAFNKIASANPVILIIRQGSLLSLATCERMNYSQEWRQGGGEKLGKVTILRNINCDNPHRGHVDILDSLGDKAYPTFEELYKHWMEIFSSELLTKKFYNELSDWYAWAVMVAKFPNDIRSEEDDAKFNHESCIRLITRLIFVWFLKQKHLIPEEFFDEKYIRENLIDNFDPHDRQHLNYDAGKSKYYRLILQNLFFAMLNCPIVAEGKTTPNNRRFMRESFQGKNPDYGINNIMRYKKEFMDGGAEKLVKLANSTVPFLNGGLFDCLDNKDSQMFYDGFSEEKKSLDQLNLPDYLFFGEEVGNGIDLSQWYDDKKKKNVSARGLIDILKRYSFTIEENTPYDQEVSLDPELLGKVFENLLAAYNPETKQSARKQTGSFYTPREIVQYMVDESLVAHLKRMCGDEMEPQYRKLLNYAADDVALSDDQRKGIMNAIYNCRVLDPACGSGAFPMGVLQQMVHVLKRIDPSNKMWENLVKDRSVQDIKKAFEDNLKKRAATPEEKAEHDKQLEERTKDIESAFNQSINDPDYARKLYLIEHCIYGVDIQPIATQISKLRFFISLVVDQKPTKDAKTNFGIRPLPNLEAKFVTANTLIPLDCDKDLYTSLPEVIEYEEQLKEINHQIFLAKKNSVKEKLRADMFTTRVAMAQTMENLGAIGSKGYDQLMEWNMFDQNASASFFDPEWMFGVKGGFDVVIGNPPYLRIQGIRASDPALADTLTSLYKSATGSFDLYACFAEKGLGVIHEEGIVNYIMPQKWTNASFGKGLRELVSKRKAAHKIIDFGAYQVFNASTYTALQWFKPNSDSLQYHGLDRDLCTNAELSSYLHNLSNESFTPIHNEKLTKDTWVLSGGVINKLLEKLNKQPRLIADIFDKIFQGLATGKDDVYFINDCTIRDNYLYGYSKLLDENVILENALCHPLLKGEDVHRYENISSVRYVLLPYNESMDLLSEDVLASNYPNCYSYLKRCETTLRSREKGRFDIDGAWFQLSRKQGLASALKQKLVAPDISMGGNFSLDNEGEFFQTATLYGYVKKNTVYESYKIWMALLNSQLCWWFIQNTGAVMSGGFYRYKPAYISPFPIPSESTLHTIETQIEEIVDFILKAKKCNSNANTSSEEQKIDHIVYHLYNLTYDEVLVIDPETPITREEYDNFKLD